MTGRDATSSVVKNAVLSTRQSTRQLPTPRLASATTSEPVATYADVRGAALAVEHLVGRGFDPLDIQVRPGDLRVRSIALAHVSHAPRRRGALIVAVLTVALWTRWHGTTASDLLLATIVAVLFAGLAYAGEDAALRFRRRRRARSTNTLVARRFQVLVARDQRRAELELARWWDPEATPAAWTGTDVGPAVELRPGRRVATAIAA